MASTECDYVIATGRGIPTAAHIPHPTAEGDALCENLDPATGTRPLSRALRQRFEIDLCKDCLRHGPVGHVGTIDHAVVRTLTDKQRTALRVAVVEGYFEWPRETTASELAESLGIAQPTFARHLRVAERKLFSALFDVDIESMGMDD
ncbi:HTH DNA binding domain-containing protein [Halogeometricum rufum]|uniref:HTH DNA binding domain-containing protein n=1 Tax=Halogeometricum rufum TaxID=553469 RepID=A0A1I6GIK6_9EURY|nr:HTH DNA binding domain-containing protein [Halogeometricum rufum]